VHWLLARNGLVRLQQQQRKQQYRRWQWDASVQLWQVDIVSGVPLTDGQSAKLVIGGRGRSRFTVVCAVVMIPTGAGSLGGVRGGDAPLRQRIGMAILLLPEHALCLLRVMTGQRPARVTNVTPETAGQWPEGGRNG
jgi:hypothetical protein